MVRTRGEPRTRAPSAAGRLLHPFIRGRGSQAAEAHPDAGSFNHAYAEQCRKLMLRADGTTVQLVGSWNIEHRYVGEQLPFIGAYTAPFMVPGCQVGCVLTQEAPLELLRAMGERLGNYHVIGGTPNGSGQANGGLVHASWKIESVTEFADTAQDVGASDQRPALVLDVTKPTGQTARVIGIHWKSYRGSVEEAKKVQLLQTHRCLAHIPDDDVETVIAGDTNCPHEGDGEDLPPVLQLYVDHGFTYLPNRSGVQTHVDRRGPGHDLDGCFIRPSRHYPCKLVGESAVVIPAPEGFDPKTLSDHRAMFWALAYNTLLPVPFPSSPDVRWAKPTTD